MFLKNLIYIYPIQLYIQRGFSPCDFEFFSDAGEIRMKIFFVSKRKNDNIVKMMTALNPAVLFLCGSFYLFPINKINEPL